LGSIRAFFTSKRVGNVVGVLLLLTVAYFFLGRGVRFFAVPSGSMEPTLLVGDQLTTIRQREYKRGDIVVFYETESEYAVKRIAGLGGDELMVNDGALFINGSYASEPYLKEPMFYQLQPPVRVPEGHIFVLGDNRNNSLDSASHGRTWPVSAIVGQVIFRHYPYGRLGRVLSFPLLTVEELAPPASATPAPEPADDAAPVP